MKKNEFFFKEGPFALNELIKSIDIIKVIDGEKKDTEKVYGIQTLDKATNSDITFLNSSRYKEYSHKTKALACITSLNLSVL